MTKYNRQRYREAQAKQFGNLHERMKYLIACAIKAGLEQFDSQTWHAIWDLQSEVEEYEPVNPAYGRRLVNAQAQ